MVRRAKPTRGENIDSGKQRTREHVIADLCENHVERLAILAGYTIQRVEKDYGYDVFLATYDDDGYLEQELVRLQLKSRTKIWKIKLRTEECFSLQVDARDYRGWCEAVFPVFLILYDADTHEAYWLHIQSYAAEQSGETPRRNVNLRIPRDNILGVETMRMMRDRKHAVLTTIQQTMQGRH
jgi:hypothetical protein